MGLYVICAPQMARKTAWKWQARIRNSAFVPHIGLFFQASQETQKRQVWWVTQHLFPKRGCMVFCTTRGCRVDSSHQEFRHWFQMDMNNLQLTQEPKKRQPPSGIKPLVPTWGCMFSVHHKTKPEETALIMNSAFGQFVEMHVLCAPQEGAEEAAPIRNLGLDPQVRLGNSALGPNVLPCVLCAPQENTDEAAPIRNWVFGSYMGLYVFPAHEAHKKTVPTKNSAFSAHIGLYVLCSLQESTVETAFLRNLAFGPQMKLHDLCAPKRVQNWQMPSGIQPLVPSWSFMFFFHHKRAQKRIPMRNFRLWSPPWCTMFIIPEEGEEEATGIRNSAFVAYMVLHILQAQ